MIWRPPAAELAAPLPEVLRLLGFKQGRTRFSGRELDLVERGIALAREAATPAACATYCAVTVEADRVRAGVPGIGWRSRSLARLLEGADGVSLVAATLGPRVDELIRDLFAQEEYALATVVDAAGSVLVQGLAEWVRQALLRAVVTGHAAGPGPKLTPLYGPGYGDWPVEEQILLVALADGAEIGLSCTPTCYLVPQKSLAGLIGWLPPGGRDWSPLGCARCTLADCAYRVRSGQEPATRADGAVGNDREEERQDEAG